MTLKTVGSRIQVILRRVDNICLAFISTSSLLTLVSCLCSTIHTWSSPFFSHTVALSAFQCFQFINSCHCFLSFPLLLSALHLANMFFFVHFFLISPFLSFSMLLFTSVSFTPLPSFLYPPPPPVVMPIFPSKNTKSRGSKHKSRRKSKKQKRPPSVCNSLT